MNRDFSRTVFETEVQAGGAFAAAWRAHWMRCTESGLELDFWKEAEMFLKAWDDAVGFKYD